MSDTTDHLKLPYILPSQAQKHVTHNEALRMLDAVVHLCVKAVGLDEPPTAPQNGDRYIVGSSSVGDWTDHGTGIAVFVDGAWMYFSPDEGWLVWDHSTARLMVFTDSAWNAVVSEVPETMSLLGVNATASQPDRLVVQSDSALFNHDGTGHRVKINKAEGGCQCQP